MAICVTGHFKYARQTGGHGQYGHVVLRVTVHDADTGVTVVNRMASGAIPTRYIPAIEDGIQTVLQEGELTRRGFLGGTVELTDGSYDAVDSSDAAFFTAAGMAMRDAVRQLPRPTDESGEPGAWPGVRAPNAPRRPTLTSSIAVPEPLDE